jgi:hypothetical protein
MTTKLSVENYKETFENSELYLRFLQVTSRFYMQFIFIILKGHFEITNSLNVQITKSFPAKVEASISTEAHAAHCCLFLSLSGYALNQPQWSTLMHNTYISLICDKSVTTQILAFFSYWYRKKRLQMHF